MMLVRGNALHLPLSCDGVQCVVTSPPYLGLRDYGLGDAGIGLEPTLEEYVANIVAVFREVWRVLRPDGTLWLNLGDCYGSGTRTSRDYSKTTKHGYWNNPAINQRNPSPAKQLLGIPWRVAFALQADGWYLRSDIIWSKPNPMPESVTDRPTKSHEYLFLLTKSARYFYDADAVREPLGDWSRKALEIDWNRRVYNDPPGKGKQGNIHGGGTGGYGNIINPAGRNRRDVWTIPTQPYRGAHFATYPEKLVELCVLAGSKAGDLVLDPFCGSGTTGAVAQRLGRRFVGMDLSEEYLELARNRIESISLGMPI